MLKSPSFKLTDGTRAHFEARRPKPGEYCGAATSTSRRYFDENGDPLWQRWINVYANAGLGAFCIFEEFDDYDSSQGYVTLVVESST